MFFFSDTCHFQKINEENSSSSNFDFHWNSVPTDIGEHLLKTLSLKSYKVENQQ